MNKLLHKFTPTMKKINPNIIRVLIVDDQQIIIDGLKAMLSGVPQVEIVAGCYDSFMALSVVEKNTPDIILMDLNMPGKDGIECVKDILEQFPDQKILMLTGYDDVALIREALRQGVAGYVLKNIGKEELIAAIKTVASGNRFLDNNVQDKVIQSFTNSSNTEPVQLEGVNQLNGLLSKREHEILKMIAEGKKSAEIASLLYISINTVDTHRKNILAKCDVRNTAELIAFATKNGMV